MKPKPFVSLNHFTVPVAISMLLLYARRHLTFAGRRLRASFHVGIGRSRPCRQRVRMSDSNFLPVLEHDMHPARHSCHTSRHFCHSHPRKDQVKVPLPIRAMLPLAALFVLAAVCAPYEARADEGMWPFNTVPVERIQKDHGVRLTDAWLQHLRSASVRFNSGG